MHENSDKIMQAVMAGRTVSEIAAEQGMSEQAALALVDRHAAKWFDGPALRRELLYEVARLDSLIARYHALAMEGKGNVEAAAIYLKALMRKSVMTGLEAPATQAAVILHRVEEVQVHKTSTEEARARLDAFMGVSVRDKRGPDDESNSGNPKSY
ncbi:hypothetical protein [Bradyrhizobium sp. UFLA05-112]